MAKKLGLCLSGGGHRATAFSLGALMYVVESGRNTDVSAISSVSGGSITNAFIATLPKPFSEYTADQFEVEAAKFASQIAGSPRWWNVAVLVYLALFIPWVCESYKHFPNNLLSTYHLYFIPPALALVCLIGPLSRGTLWGWWGTWLYCALLIFAIAWNIVFAVAWYVGTAWPRGLPGWSLLLLAALVLLAFFARGQIAEWAFAATINKGMDDREGAGRPLKSLPSTVRHVFCATELHSGRHAYYSHDLIYVPFVGVAEPVGMKLSTAVQVSANFPGAFPARVLRRRRRQEFVQGSGFQLFTPHLFALTDGGVYDNTGASWFLEAKERPDGADRWRREDLRSNPPPKSGLTLMPESVRARAAAQIEEMRSWPDQLIVLNASEPDPWRTVGGALVPVWGEVKHLLYTTLITYAVRGREQAKEQMHRFLRPSVRRNLQGVAVSAASDPAHLAIALSQGHGEWSYDDILRDAEVDYPVIARARAVNNAIMKRVEDITEAFRYPQIVLGGTALKYSYVPTTLRPLGESDTARLLWNGYWQTMVNAAVMLDDCPILDPSPPDFARFQALASGRSRPRPPISQGGADATPPVVR